MRLCLPASGFSSRDYHPLAGAFYVSAPHVAGTIHAALFTDTSMRDHYIRLDFDYFGPCKCLSTAVLCLRSVARCLYAVGPCLGAVPKMLGSVSGRFQVSQSLFFFFAHRCVAAVLARVRYVCAFSCSSHPWKKFAWSTALCFSNTRFRMSAMVAATSSSVG
jgi:hypothetical protein